MDVSAIMPGHPNLKAWFMFNPDTEIVSGTTGTPTSITYEAGPFGQSAVMDATSDKIDWGYLSALNVERTQPWTILQWIKRDSNTQEGEALSQNGDSTHGWGQGWGVGGNSLRLANFNAAQALRKYWGSAVGPDSAYRHVVYTYDGSSLSAGAKLYMDGVDQGAGTALSNNLSGSIITTGAPSRTGYANYFNYAMIGKINVQMFFDYLMPIEDQVSVGLGFDSMSRSQL